MFSPKTVLLLATGSLILGGVTGRLTAPSAAEHPSNAQTRSPSEKTADIFSSDATETSPGARSRAIADVTPGKESGKDKPIPSVAELLRITDYRKLYRNSERLADSLDQAGVQKALALVDQAPDGSNAKQSLLYSLINRLTELDPRAAIQYAQSLKSDTRNGLFNAIAASWGSTDFNAAKAWAQQLPDKRQRSQAMQGLIGATMEKNPDLALQMAIAQKKTGGDSYYIYSIFQTLAGRSPQGAAAKALALPNGEGRQQAVNAVGSKWAATDPIAASQWAETLPPGLRQNTLSNIVSNWSRTDPTAAAAYAEKMTKGETKNNVISNLVSNWAQQDSDAALRWAGSISDPETRKQALGSTLSSWAQNDAQAAADYIAKLPKDANSKAYLQNIGYQWGSQDPEGALKWAAAQNDPAFTGELVRNVLNRWSSSDPEKAVAALDLLPNDESRNQATEQIASQWAHNDPAKAITWLTTLPEGKTRENSMVNAVANWTQNSPEDVPAWLSKLPSGGTRDKMVGTFAGNVLAQDPEASAAWSASINDPVTRKSGVAWALKSWAANDAPAATAWVNQQTFTAEDRAAFFNSISSVKPAP